MNAEAGFVLNRFIRTPRIVARDYSIRGRMTHLYEHLKSPNVSMVNSSGKFKTKSPSLGPFDVRNIPFVIVTER